MIDKIGKFLKWGTEILLKNSTTVFVATTTDEEAEFNPGSYRTLSLWRTLALVIYVGRCLMTVLFMAAIFVIFVLLTHEPSMNYGGEIRYLHSAF